MEHYNESQLSNPWGEWSPERTQFLKSKATVEVNGKLYVAPQQQAGPAVFPKTFSTREIATGQKFMVIADGWPVQFLEVLGFVAGPANDTDPQWKTIKEVFNHYQVRGLKALEEKQTYEDSTHMLVRDLRNGDQGGWLYVYSGKWSMGTGANPVKFYLIEDYDAAKWGKQQAIIGRQAEIEQCDEAIKYIEQKIEKLQCDLQEWQQAKADSQTALDELLGN